MALIFCGAWSSSALAPAAAATAGFDEFLVAGFVSAKSGGVDSRPGNSLPKQLRSFSHNALRSVMAFFTPSNCQIVGGGQQGVDGPATFTVVAFAEVVDGVVLPSVAPGVAAGAPPPAAAAGLAPGAAVDAQPAIAPIASTSART